MDEMNKVGEQEDIHEADVIIEDIKKLILREEAEEEKELIDLQHLEAALAAMEQFQKGEKAEIKEPIPMGKVTPVINTDVLTGPMSGLKNYLIKKTRDNEAK